MSPEPEEQLVDGSDAADTAGPDEPQTLLFESSPYGNIDAIVQHDSQSVHFYLNGPASFGTRACWVRNLSQGPYVLDTDAMQQGRAVMLPRTHCRNPAGGELPRADDLQVLWLEEGNGAALMEHDKPLCVVPPWSGNQGFHGYAEECIAESELCWPMPQDTQLQRRLSRAAEFWRQAATPDSKLFSDLQKTLLQSFNQSWASSRSADYFAIDGQHFPPRGLNVYRTDQGVVAVTVGMSLCPQPNVEMFSDRPSQFRRVELGIDLVTERPPESLNNLWQAISGMAAYPWRHFSWLGAGHTFKSEALAGTLGPESSHVALLPDESLAGPASPIQFRDDPVNLLWIVPITSAEQQKLEQNQMQIGDLHERRTIRLV